jgi:hypothetical protein
MREKLEKIEDFLSRFNCETLLKNIKSEPRAKTINSLSSALKVMNRNAYKNWVTYAQLTNWIDPNMGVYVDVLKQHNVFDCFSVINAFEYFKTRKNNGHNEYYSDREVVEKEDVIKIAAVKNIFHNKIKHTDILNRLLAEKKSENLTPSVNFQPVETDKTINLMSCTEIEKGCRDENLNLYENIKHLEKLAEEMRNERGRCESATNKLLELLNSDAVKKAIEVYEQFKK